MSPLVKATIFYALTLGQSLGIALFLTPIFGEITLLAVMMTPLVSVLVMKLVVTREGWRREGWSDLGLQRLGLRQMAIAIALPIVVLAAAYGIVWATGVAQFNSAGLSNWGPWDRFVLNLSVALVVCFGEEIGWRGYLLPKLMPLGHRTALLLSGLLQAIWHVPFIVFTVYYHGDGNAWIVVPLFLATMSVAGVLFGYLRLASGSVWPAVIAHAVVNVYWSMFNAVTLTDTPLAYEYLAGESGILTLTGVAIAAVWLIRRMENPKSGIDLSARVAYAG
jgi:uncharacterized protein